MQTYRDPLPAGSVREKVNAMTVRIRRRLQSVRQPLPRREDLNAMPKPDQFDRIDTDNLRAFHFGQLKWAIERDYTPIILQLETEDDRYDFQHKVTHQQMELEERNALWPEALYVKAAVVDPRPQIEESYAEVQLEHDQAGIRASCTCEWSRRAGRTAGPDIATPTDLLHIMTGLPHTTPTSSGSMVNGRHASPATRRSSMRWPPWASPRIYARGWAGRLMETTIAERFRNQDLTRSLGDRGSAARM
ncbi:MAG: hypothetical protein R3A46_12600 [Thermomicrobiales bacterium]